MSSECWNNFLRQPPKICGLDYFTDVRFNFVIFYIESKLDLWAFRISSFKILTMSLQCIFLIFSIKLSGNFDEILFSYFSPLTINSNRLIMYYLLLFKSVWNIIPIILYFYTQNHFWFFELDTTKTIAKC